MSFMQPEMTVKQWWLSIDGNCGIDFIPQELFDVNAVRAIIDGQEDANYATKILEIVYDYTENSTATEAELIFGYGVRSSAPGYMDCTPWEVFTNLSDAKAAYNAHKRECQEDDYQ